MKLHEPVKGYKNELYPKGDVAQWFGENVELYLKSGRNSNGHPGIDIVRPLAAELYAVESGEVVEVKNENTENGRHLRFISDTGNMWTYGHNLLNLVQVGQKVIRGGVIARMGNTGFSVSGSTPFWKHNPHNGVHVHLERTPVSFIKPNQKVGNVRFRYLDLNNGFQGATDFKNELPSIKEEVNKVYLVEALKALYARIKHMEKQHDFQPLVKRQSEAFIEAVKVLGFDLRVTSDYRSVAEQNALYAQGRTTPGAIVTNAIGGQSSHNYGVSFDVVDRKRGYNLTDKEWKQLGAIWKAYTGGTWGGDWKTFPDQPHFENLLDYSLKDFQEDSIDESELEISIRMIQMQQR